MVVEKNLDAPFLRILDRELRAAEWHGVGRLLDVVDRVLALDESDESKIGTLRAIVDACRRRDDIGLR